MGVRLAIVWLLLFTLGCGSSPEPEPEVCEEPPAVVSQGLSPIDCSESTNTGYTSGNAFTITVVTVDGKPVEVQTANAYYVMAQAAAADGVTLKINSGFRTMAEQEYLYGCYINCNCNNCNLAAKPGYSNHQSGHALDLNTSSGGVYAWLEANAAAFGFERTVPSEAWHWEWWGGGPGGGPCGNKAPTGWLDSATCDAVTGWTQDPDDPGKSIDVHLYFGGPAGSAAVGKGWNANVHRDDLCAAIGSCEHGFSAIPPLSLLDGQPHPVHAYGIDATGGANAELSGSPGSLACLAPTPSGIRRHVTNPESLAAWKLDPFWHALPLDDSAIDAIPEGDALPQTPSLVQADDGSSEVWLVDGTHRRHVPDPTVLANWGWAFSDVQVKPAAEVDALEVGPVVRTSPVLVVADSGKVDLIDDPFDVPGTGGGGTGGSATGSGGKSGGAGKAEGGQQSTTLVNDEGSCSIGQKQGESRSSGLWFLLGLALLARRFTPRRP
jgi:hypothetical protein